jgi:hypothetical protein
MLIQQNSYYGDNNETPTMPAKWRQRITSWPMKLLCAWPGGTRSVIGDNHHLRHAFWQSLCGSFAGTPV